LTTLVHVSLEPNSHNTDGATVTLYFDGVPTREEVREACKTKLGGLPLSVDTEDEFFSYEEHSVPVNELAGLRRFEVYPTV